MACESRMLLATVLTRAQNGGGKWRGGSCKGESLPGRKPLWKQTGACDEKATMEAYNDGVFARLDIFRRKNREADIMVVDSFIGRVGDVEGIELGHYGRLRGQESARCQVSSDVSILEFRR